MFRLLIQVSFIFSSYFSFSQTDQKKLDSLQQSIKSSTDSFQQWQDSFNKAQIQKSIERSQINTIEFAKQYQEQKKKREREQAIRYIIIGVVFLILLVAGLAKRKKKATS